MSLNPSIVRKGFIREALPYFNVGLDPEKQLRGLQGPDGPVLDHWRYLYYGKPGERSYVIDIGKKWRRSFRLRKAGGGTQPTIWTSDFNRAGLALAFLQLKYRFFLRFWRLLAVSHPAGKHFPGPVGSVPK